jgi:hypothetical protein
VMGAVWPPAFAQGRPQVNFDQLRRKPAENACRSRMTPATFATVVS